MTPRVTAKARHAYEVITGRPFPESPAKADVARAQVAQVMYERDRRSWAAKKAANTRGSARAKRVDAPTERMEQAALARYLDGLGVLWCHVPNEGSRSGRYGAGLKSQGMKKGVPDVLIFTAPPARHGVRGVAIELKRLEGSRTSQHQRQWQDGLAMCGWLVRTCYGADEAMRWLEELGWALGTANDR